jgi:zinc transport system substrate-binding protein
MRAVLVAVALLAALGCGGDRSAAPASGERAGGAAATRQPLDVLVDSYPLLYFAQRIGGGHATVSFPAPPGVDPAFWNPDAATVARYQKADLIVIDGAGYAHWITTATLPDSRVVDTSAAFTDRLLVVQGAVTHSHGGQGEHSHAGTATCWWLDPTLAIEQANAIAAAFARERPEGKPAFDAGLAALRRDLETLDARLAAVASRIGTTPLLFSHPVYDYLIRRYSFNARTLHWEPNESPDPAGWAQLEEKLAGHPAHLLIWEAAPTADTATELERRGIESVVFAPLAETPSRGDYLSAMNENAARLEAAFPPT